MSNVEPGDSQAAIQLLKSKSADCKKQQTTAENIAAIVGMTSETQRNTRNDTIALESVKERNKWNRDSLKSEG
jgi:hypothetical protein